MDDSNFRYSTPCSAPDCGNSPRFKVAAPWSYGPLRELKNYGLACEEHRDWLLARAREHRERLAVGDDEAVGAAEVYEFAPGHRDVELPRLPGGDA